MTGSILKKFCGTCVAITLLLVPVSVFSATSIQFDFNTTILETFGSSPINIGDQVTGSLQVDTGDFQFSSTEPVDFLGGMPLEVSVFQGSSTWGYAQAPGWSQLGPGFAVGLATINDYVLVPGDMDDYPEVASTFLNTPSAGDLIDAIVITVFENNFLSAPDTKSINFGFVYDAGAGVVTGSGLAGIDADQLFSSALFHVFSASVTLDDSQSTLVWEAAAPIPVPAAVWLFGSGLIGLIGFSKHKKAA